VRCLSEAHVEMLYTGYDCHLHRCETKKMWPSLKVLWSQFVLAHHYNFCTME